MGGSGSLDSDNCRRPVLPGGQAIRSRCRPGARAAHATRLFSSLLSVKAWATNTGLQRVPGQTTSIGLLLSGTKRASSFGTRSPSQRPPNLSQEAHTCSQVGWLPGSRCPQRLRADALLLTEPHLILPAGRLVQSEQGALPRRTLSCNGDQSRSLNTLSCTGLRQSLTPCDVSDLDA